MVSDEIAQVSCRQKRYRQHLIVYVYIHAYIILTYTGPWCYTKLLLHSFRYHMMSELNLILTSPFVSIVYCVKFQCGGGRKCSHFLAEIPTNSTQHHHFLFGTRLA